MRFMTVTEMLMLLEVTSFLTITGIDLADRFSISGTIFLPGLLCIILLRSYCQKLAW